MSEEIGNVKRKKYATNQAFVNQFWADGGYMVSRNRFRIYRMDKKVGKYVYVRKPRLELLKYWDTEENRLGLCKEDVFTFLSAAIDEEKDKLREIVRITCTTNCVSHETELWRVAKIIAKTDIVKQNEFIVAIKYWIQSILHKMNDAQFIWPIIPIFWSTKHGSGKSTLMLKLCEPLQPFVMDADLQKISDQEKNYRIFTDYYIITMEEIAKASKGDIETIKRIATSGTVSARLYHTQEQTSETNIATQIGTSNVPMSRILNDTTDNRRFFDINVPDEITQKEIESINALEIFQSQHIWNEDEVETMRVQYERYLKPKQQEAKKQDYVQEFIDVANVKIDVENSSASAINLTDLFGNFNRWYMFQNIKTGIRLKDFKEQFSEKMNIVPRRTKHRALEIYIDLGVYVPDCVELLRHYPNRYRNNLGSHLNVVQ